jgi:DNA-binding transcriptional ArsR family regulator/uncharacterized protein YndB with AHSA1/START domain
MGAVAEPDRRSLQTVLDAVSSPIRREILWLVWDRELAAGDIAAEFEVTGPTISSHLAALRAAGLVTLRADGNFRRYRADREAVAVLVPLLQSGGERWQPADDLPERSRAESSVARWVRVTTDVPVEPGEVFDDFVDGERYGRWLGVPVTIDQGRFSARMEWGTTVRGHYEVQARPSLIAMRWDFDDDAVPVPGRQLVAYLRLTPTDDGTHVEVHQEALDDEQARYLTAAWSMVLGRLHEHHDGTRPAAPARRPRRPKRRT